jgi:photosystem II stability/assembly factor-like uncharacterized protein
VSGHAIFDELFAHIISERIDDGGAVPLDEGSRSANDLRRSLRPPGRLILVVAAAVVVALVLAIAGTLGRSNTLSGPITTPWQAAHIVPSDGRISPTAASGSWRLVGAIVHTGWQLHTAGPVPGYLTCPTAFACYVIGDTAKSPSGPPEFGALYVSQDAGSSWVVLPLPSGLSATSGLSCPGPETCAAGGVLNGQSVFLSTADGGHQWRIVPFTVGGDLISLSCSSASTCNGVTAPSSEAYALQNGLSPHDLQFTETFVRTTDAGGRWNLTHQFPDGDHVASMSCPSALQCIIVGYPVTALFGPNPSGFVASTRDGGDHWSPGQLPHGFGFFYVNSGISCADTAYCMALGQIVVPNPDQCEGASQPPPAGFVGCSSGPTVGVSGIATTNDGGTTWQMRSLPSNVPLPEMSAMSCASASICWLSGEEAVPQDNGSGGGSNGGSSVILGTVDGGATWTKVTFTVPPGAPEDIGHDSYMAIGEISCPTTTACIALGVSDQGSPSTAVYSYRSSP